MTNSTHPQKSFFNLTAKGIGWINRIRAVKKGRHTFYACTFNALRGEEDENGHVEQTTFELLVKGSKAKDHFIRILENGYTKEDKVWASLDISDIRPDLNDAGAPNSFVRKDGTHLVVIRANLLRINYLKLNGEYVVHAEKPAESESSQDDTQDEANASESESTASVVEEEAAA